MGPADPNYEFLFVSTNPYLGAKVRIGRRDADAADPAGLVPGADAEDLVQWFKRMGLGPNQLCMFGSTCTRATRRRAWTSPRRTERTARCLTSTHRSASSGSAPGPAVTIIKKFKDMTDNYTPGGNPYVGGDDPPYVEYARIRGGGEIPRVTTFGAFPGSADLGSSKFAQKVREAAEPRERDR